VTVPIRRTFRFAGWTLRPGHDTDGPPLWYAFRCLALNTDDTERAARSSPSNDPTEPQTWALAHLREHPGHTSYAEVIERPWVR